MTKYGHVSYIYITIAFVKLPWQYLGVPAFGAVKLRSA